MPKFLIDVNLPYRFARWSGEQFVHQIEINPTATDEAIWEFACESELTAVTKDSDFSHRMMLSEPPPKVIHVRLGNMKMKDFFAAVNAAWDDVVSLSEDHKLVNLFQDRIEAIE